MTQQLRFDGTTVKEAIEKANKICGPGTKVVFAQRIRSKRGFGLWTKMRYEIVVEPSPASKSGEAVDTKSFADELRTAISSDVYASRDTAEERFRVRSKATTLQKYRQYSGDVTEEPEQRCEDTSPDVDFQRAAENSSQMGAMIYKRNGTRGYLETFDRPVWAVEGSNVDEISVDLTSNLQSIPSEPWGSAINSRVDTSIIDLTNNRIAQSVSLAIDEMDEVVDEEVVNQVIALRSLHELPQVCDGTLVLLTSSNGEDSHRSVSEVGRRFNIKEERRVFLQGPFDSTMPEDPKEILSALKRGESVMVMASKSAVIEFQKIFPKDRLLVVVEVDASQPLPSTMDQLALLGKVDAISVTKGNTVFDPHSIVSLGLPILALNGKASSVSQWLNLLMNRRDGLVR